MILKKRDWKIAVQVNFNLFALTSWWLGTLLFGEVQSIISYHYHLYHPNSQDWSLQTLMKLSPSKGFDDGDDDGEVKECWTGTRNQRILRRISLVLCVRDEQIYKFVNASEESSDFANFLLPGSNLTSFDFATVIFVIENLYLEGFIKTCEFRSVHLLASHFSNCITSLTVLLCDGEKMVHYWNERGKSTWGCLSICNKLWDKITAPSNYIHLFSDANNQTAVSYGKTMREVHRLVMHTD